MVVRKSRRREKKNEPITKEFFVRELKSLKKHLDLKIEYSRQDAKDHLESVSRRLSDRMDFLASRVYKIESRLTTVEEVVLEINRDVKVIAKKVDRHDQEISVLQEAVNASQ